MVGKLEVKLQAKQKMLRKAHNKLATQAKFMAARAELSTKQSGIKNYFSSLATILEDPAVDEEHARKYRRRRSRSFEYLAAQSDIYKFGCLNNTTIMNNYLV